MTTDVTSTIDKCHSDSENGESASTVMPARAHLQSSSRSSVTSNTHVQVDSSSDRQLKSRFGCAIKPVDSSAEKVVCLFLTLFPSFLVSSSCIVWLFCSLVFWIF